MVWSKRNFSKHTALEIKMWTITKFSLQSSDGSAKFIDLFLIFEFITLYFRLHSRVVQLLHNGLDLLEQDKNFVPSLTLGVEREHVVYCSWRQRLSSMLIR